MLIDTHCHLDAPEFDADRDAVLATARANGVGAIVIPAVFRREWDDAQALADAHADVYFALGIHPLYVDDAADDDLDALRHGTIHALRALGRSDWTISCRGWTWCASSASSRPSWPWRATSTCP